MYHSDYYGNEPERLDPREPWPLGQEDEPAPGPEGSAKKHSEATEHEGFAKKCEVDSSNSEKDASESLRDMQWNSLRCIREAVAEYREEAQDDCPF